MEAKTIYVALGSNLGDRKVQLARGVEAMARRGLGILAISSVWETEPVDSPEPLWFFCPALNDFPFL